MKIKTLIVALALLLSGPAWASSPCVFKNSRDNPCYVDQVKHESTLFSKFFGAFSLMAAPFILLKMKNDYDNADPRIRSNYDRIYAEHSPWLKRVYGTR